ncbi:MAG: hypothetical protein WC956_03610 [bacterium]
MSANMTWKEIIQDFPNEWVAIIDSKGDTESPFGSISGEVITHNADEAEFTKALKKITSRKRVDIRFTGDILPDNPVGPVLWQISNTSS